MSRQRRCVIVGAGLTGASCAWKLSAHGFDVRVIEQAPVVGGHVRTEWFRGIPYEPNGAHIFHTNDEEVWRVASSRLQFVPYEHRVLTRVNGQVLSWPVQVEELRRLPE